MADELLFEKANGIATITLNRPEKLNTFHNEMLADWAAALRECQADDAVAVVVLTGAGRAFCAGGDLGTMGEVEGNAALYMGDYLRDNVHPVARAVDALQKPYLCAVNGVATGAGMDMALMTDIRYAARSARFAESYIKVGLIPGDGGAFPPASPRRAHQGARAAVDRRLRRRGGGRAARDRVASLRRRAADGGADGSRRASGRRAPGGHPAHEAGRVPVPADGLPRRARATSRDPWASRSTPRTTARPCGLSQRSGPRLHGPLTLPVTEVASVAGARRLMARDARQRS